MLARLKVARAGNRLIEIDPIGCLEIQVRRILPMRKVGQRSINAAGEVHAFIKRERSRRTVSRECKQALR